MTVNRHFLFACAIAASTIVSSPTSATPAAQAFVERVGNDVLGAARAGSAARFKQLLQRNAAIGSIALYSLGRFRKKLPQSRKREYYRLVAGHISKVFATHSKKLAGNALTVQTSHARGKSIIVKSRLKYPSGQTTPVTWRLLKAGSGFKIFDVNVKGIWLANTQKTDFTAILRRSGGDINALFAYLKK